VTNVPNVPANNSAPVSGAGETQVPAPGNGDQNTDAITKAIEAALKPFADKFGKLEGQYETLKKDVIKARKRAADSDDDAPESKPNGSSKDKQQAGGADLLALMDLSSAIASLPEASRAKVREQLAEGASPAELLQRIAFARELGSGGMPDPSKGGKPTPTGEGGSPPREQPGLQFRTWNEWRKAKHEKGRDWEQNYLRTHPDFEPTELEGSPGKRSR
jgi:hypothetical protein